MMSNDYEIQIVTARIEDSAPRAYRLVDKNGVIGLQGQIFWQQGTEHGFEWKDLKTIKL